MRSILVAMLASMMSARALAQQVITAGVCRNFR